jgi:hypothetical protein
MDFIRTPIQGCEADFFNVPDTGTGASRLAWIGTVEGREEQQVSALDKAGRIARGGLSRGPVHGDATPESGARIRDKCWHGYVLLKAEKSSRWARWMRLEGSPVEG